MLASVPVGQVLGLTMPCTTDVCCGISASIIIMAAYLASRFFGFDYHAPSIDKVRELTTESGDAAHVAFNINNA